MRRDGALFFLYRRLAVRPSRAPRGAARLRALAMAVGLVAAVAAALPAAGLAVVPNDGGPLTPDTVTIDAGSGDQWDPHVDGDLATYTSGVTIRYFDFGFGPPAATVPVPSGSLDVLSDVSSGKIVLLSPRGREKSRHAL